MPDAPGAVMLAEMDEQPAVVGRLVERGDDLFGEVARRPDEYAGILLIARGSSDHAAVYGRYVLELATRHPVALAAPSLFTRYDSRTRLHGWLAIAVSQSGTTPEIVDTLRAAASAGATTLAVTNVADSPLAEAAQATAWLDAGTEEAVPATKTFTGQVTAFGLLAERLGDPAWQPSDWGTVIESMGTVLADRGPAERAAERMVDTSGLLAVARGLTYAASLETALKLAETTGLPASGTSTADLLHGPIAATGPDVHAIGLLAPGPCLDDVRDTATRLDERGVPLTVVAPGDVGPLPGSRLPVPGGVPEALAPLVLVVRGQQIAHRLARALGRDPDRPAGLSKVTPTH